MKKILIIDDEKDVLTYLETLFKDNGYEAAVACNGEEGLTLARKDVPDLITLDITMPEKTGIKAYKELRQDEKLKNVPIIVVTAVTGYAGSSADVEKFLGTRNNVPAPNGFMAKPIKRDELLQMVKGLIG